MRERTIFAGSSGGSRITVTHRDSDPGMWIVRRWDAVLWFKRRSSSVWFSDRDQAIAFASALQAGSGTIAAGSSPGA